MVPDFSMGGISVRFCSGQFIARERPTDADSYGTTRGYLLVNSTLCDVAKRLSFLNNYLHSLRRPSLHERSLDIRINSSLNMAATKEVISFDDIIQAG